MIGSLFGSLIGSMIGLARDSLRRWDHFLFESCDPLLAPVLRIGFALLMVIQTLCVWPDAAYWYSDSGVLKSQTAEQILGPQAWSLLHCLDSEPWIAQLGLLCLMIHSGLMLLGCYSRFQVAAIFVWLVSFQNRHLLLAFLDGFLLCFRPLLPHHIQTDASYVRGDAYHDRFLYRCIRITLPRN